MEGKDRQAIWFLVGLFLGMAMGIVGATLLRQTHPTPIVIEPPEPTLAPEATATPGPIQVYVTGEVANVGVYTLPPDSIIADAIQLAGSFTAEAALERVNLAQPLGDGMQVHVPTVAERLVAAQPVITEPSEPAAAAPAAAGNSAQPEEPEDGLININTADEEELSSLPGIGPVTAEKIIAYREAHGPFERVEDIMDVDGIGEGKFEQIKELITVG